MEAYARQQKSFCASGSFSLTVWHWGFFVPVFFHTISRVLVRFRTSAVFLNFSETKVVTLFCLLSGTCENHFVSKLAVWFISKRNCNATLPSVNHWTLKSHSCPLSFSWENFSLKKMKPVCYWPFAILICSLIVVIMTDQCHGFEVGC